MIIKRCIPPKPPKTWAERKAYRIDLIARLRDKSKEPGDIWDEMAKELIASG